MILLPEQTIQVDNHDNILSKKTGFKLTKLVSDGNWDYPFVIKRSEIRLNDSLFSLGYLFTEEIESFEIEQLPIQSAYSESSISSTVSFYISGDLIRYTRTTYSLLDYLRDIGGLFGAFNAIFGSIVFILNFNGLYQLLTSTLFRVQSLTSMSQKDRHKQTRGKSQM